MKRREEKGKGQRETYTHLNVEFQRITRRDKKGKISAKKYRSIIEWERLEISSSKLEYQGNISCKDGHNKGKK